MIPGALEAVVLPPEEEEKEGVWAFSLELDNKTGQGQSIRRPQYLSTGSYAVSAGTLFSCWQRNGNVDGGRVKGAPSETASGGSCNIGGMGTAHSAVMARWASKALAMASLSVSVSISISVSVSVSVSVCISGPQGRLSAS